MAQTTKPATLRNELASHEFPWPKHVERDPHLPRVFGRGRYAIEFDEQRSRLVAFKRRSDIVGGLAIGALTNVILGVGLGGFSFVVLNRERVALGVFALIFLFCGPSRRHCLAVGLQKLFPSATVHRPRTQDLSAGGFERDCPAG